jgi:excisionase family DNA binding protein
MDVPVSPLRATYTVADMAEMLGVCEEVVRRLLRKGEMPGGRIGGQWRVHRGTFDAWVEKTFS